MWAVIDKIYFTCEKNYMTIQSDLFLVNRTFYLQARNSSFLPLSHVHDMMIETSLSQFTVFFSSVTVLQDKISSSFFCFRARGIVYVQ